MAACFFKSRESTVCWWVLNQPSGHGAPSSKHQDRIKVPNRVAWGSPSRATVLIANVLAEKGTDAIGAEICDTVLLSWG